MRGKLIYTVILILFAGLLNAQEHKADSLLCVGDSLRAHYRFEESIEAYSQALEVATDSVFMLTDSLMHMTIRDRMLLSENGKTMAAYADNPVVVARHKFSLNDFFLYYPLPDKSWRKTPNQLDTLGNCSLAKAV